MRLAFQCNIPAHLHRKILGDRKPKAISLHLAVARVFHCEQPFKHRIRIFRADPVSSVCNINLYLRSVGSQAYPQILPVSAVSDCIGDQVEHNPLQCFPVGAGVDRLLRNVNIHRKFSL